MIEQSQSERQDFDILDHEVVLRLESRISMVKSDGWTIQLVKEKADGLITAYEVHIGLFLGEVTILNLPIKAPQLAGSVLRVESNGVVYGSRYHKNLIGLKRISIPPSHLLHPSQHKYYSSHLMNAICQVVLLKILRGIASPIGFEIISYDDGIDFFVEYGKHSATPKQEVGKLFMTFVQKILSRLLMSELISKQKFSIEQNTFFSEEINHYFICDYLTFLRGYDSHSSNKFNLKNQFLHTKKQTLSSYPFLQYERLYEVFWNGKAGGMFEAQTQVEKFFSSNMKTHAIKREEYYQYFCENDKEKKDEEWLERVLKVVLRHPELYGLRVYHPDDRDFERGAMRVIESPFCVVGRIFNFQCEKYFNRWVEELVSINDQSIRKFYYLIKRVKQEQKKKIIQKMATLLELPASSSIFSLTTTIFERFSDLSLSLIPMYLSFLNDVSTLTSKFKAYVEQKNEKYSSLSQIEKINIHLSLFLTGQKLSEFHFLKLVKFNDKTLYLYVLAIMYQQHQKFKKTRQYLRYWLHYPTSKNILLFTDRLELFRAKNWFYFQHNERKEIIEEIISRGAQSEELYDLFRYLHAIYEKNESTDFFHQFNKLTKSMFKKSTLHQLQGDKAQIKLKKAVKILKQDRINQLMSPLEKQRFIVRIAYIIENNLTDPENTTKFQHHLEQFIEEISQIKEQKSEFFCAFFFQYAIEYKKKKIEKKIKQNKRQIHFIAEGFESDSSEQLETKDELIENTLSFYHHYFPLFSKSLSSYISAQIFHLCFLEFKKDKKTIKVIVQQVKNKIKEIKLNQKQVQKYISFLYQSLICCQFSVLQEFIEMVQNFTKSLYEKDVTPIHPHYFVYIPSVLLIRSSKCYLPFLFQVFPGALKGLITFSEDKQQYYFYSMLPYLMTLKKNDTFINLLLKSIDEIQSLHNNCYLIYALYWFFLVKVNFQGNIREKITQVIKKFRKAYKKQNIKTLFVQNFCWIYDNFLLWKYELPKKGQQNLNFCRSYILKLNEIINKGLSRKEIPFHDKIIKQFELSLSTNQMQSKKVQRIKKSIRNIFNLAIQFR